MSSERVEAGSYSSDNYPDYISSANSVALCLMDQRHVRITLNLKTQLVDSKVINYLIFIE